MSVFSSCQSLFIAVIILQFPNHVYEYKHIKDPFGSSDTSELQATKVLGVHEVSGAKGFLLHHRQRRDRRRNEDADQHRQL